MIGLPRCKECNQPAGVDLDVSDTGYSVGSKIQHLPTCSFLRCSHGKLWTEDCVDCNAETSDWDEEE